MASMIAQDLEMTSAQDLSLLCLEGRDQLSLETFNVRTEKADLRGKQVHTPPFYMRDQGSERASDLPKVTHDFPEPGPACVLLSLILPERLALHTSLSPLHPPSGLSVRSRTHLILGYILLKTHFSY